MKRLLLTYIMLLFTCLSLIGQVNQIWYKKGKVLYAVPVAGIDSVTYGQFVSADTFLIVIDRASRRIVYDTIDVHVPGMVFHDTIHTTHTVHLKPGRRIGVFSVAKDKQVSFSQGNLQYVQNQNVWKFADQQYEMIGARNVKDGQLANKIDLFGWSANNTTAPFGVSTSTNNADYSGDFVDWGTNTINYEEPNTWRTLSKDEWEYLINKRDKATLLYGAACINGINGVLFMPDNWVCPDSVIFESGMASKKGSEYYKTQNNYSLDQWSILENSGAVFLPATGRRIVEPVNINEFGNYWSNTIKSSKYSHYLAYNSNQLYVNAYEESYKGRSVRLVHDTIVPKPSKRIGVFSVAKDKQVSFSQGNLQYVQNQNVWKFADQQYEMIGARNVKDGQLANKIDLFGWSANNTTAPFGVSTSTNNADYSGDFVDWGTNTINYEDPNTWRTLSKDEWEYLLNERPNATLLCGVACVNGINGFIFLPDNWKLPEEIFFTSGVHTGYGETYFKEINNYTLEQWRKMEYQGAVFLPASGICNGLEYTQSGIAGSYYSASSFSKDKSYIFNFRSNVTRNIGEYRRVHRSVRLVHDTIVPQSCESITINVNNVSFNMVCVEGGTFMMGAMEGDTKANANEKPTHEVTLTHNYHIGQTEVTQALWKAVMGSDNNPSTIKGDNLPVNNVLWGDAMTFIYKLNQITGLSFDLPTEAEWEFAARGGNKSKGYLYAGSNNASDIAWISSNSGGTTHSVATKQPNELGIYDMSGNVFEWCKDWLAPYSAESQVNPKGPISGEYHVYRGGGWYLANIYCRSSHRRQTKAGYTEAALGFRVVLREKVEPEYVDLGLSIKWATFNIGATTPEEYGDYFAWGETEPKDIYSWTNYRWGNGENKSLTKYCNKSTYGIDGFTDNLTQLLPEDDAAHVNWGGNWRMPTAAEFDELINNCTIEKTTMNGANGYILTSKINGNSIFLPMAGCYNFDLQQDKLYENNSILYYWSVDMWYNDNNYNINAYNLSSRLAEDGYLSISNNTRRCGFPIRPIYDDNIIPNPCLVVKINDTLSINMMCVEGGTFMMGASDDDKKADKDERPQHQVTLTYDYHIMQTEVTQGLWEAVMGEDIYDLRAKSRSPEEKIKFVGGDYPVFYVRFSQCLEFIERLNELTGLHFRMPSEAEWEYAARGGHLSKSYLYSGSNDANEVAAIGYVAATGYAFKPVASLRPNELGIYDMSGNIAEMTLDFAHGVSAPYPSAEPQINPRQISPYQRICR